MLGESKQFLLKWNEDFPLDHWWRKKYNIPFNSPKHRATSYIDMYYDWLEQQMFDQYIQDEKIRVDKLANMKKTGKWLAPIENTEDTEKMVDMFDNLDVSLFNEHLIEEDIEDENTDNPEI